MKRWTREPVVIRALPLPPLPRPPALWKTRLAQGFLALELACRALGQGCHGVALWLSRWE